MCQDDEYESEDLLDFTNANTLRKSVLPLETLLIESSDEELSDCHLSQDIINELIKITYGL